MVLYITETPPVLQPNTGCSGYKGRFLLGCHFPPFTQVPLHNVYNNSWFRWLKDYEKCKHRENGAKKV